MATSIHMFDKFLQEANTYFTNLANGLGHPDETNRVVMAWKAVMHTIRDRIHPSESFHMMSQMPMILKGMYVDGWTWSESAPLDYDTGEEMARQVEKYQMKFGETGFDWSISTEEMITAIVDSMNEYWTEGQVEHIKDMMPEDAKELIA